MNNRIKKALAEFKSLFLLIVIILTIKVTIFEMYIVPTGSMENTIMTGDFLVGNRFVYGMRTPDRIGLMDFSVTLPSLKFPSFKEPKRGDVIIFKFPRDTRQKYVKRCVAEPGDLLDIKDKVIKYQKFIKDNFKYVGENFTYEARSLHYNPKKKEKGIYGKASNEEIKELKEEGIETEIIPWLDNNAN